MRRLNSVALRYITCKAQLVQTKYIPNEALVPLWKDIIDSGRTVTLRARGRSMRPMWHHNRDSVCLSALSKPLAVGQVVLAEVEPKCYVIHRIVALSEDEVVLRGDGNPYSAERVSPDKVLGIITSFTLHLGKRAYTYSTESLLWRLHSALWPNNVLLRRILLKIDRFLFGTDDLTL